MQKTSPFLKSKTTPQAPKSLLQGLINPTAPLAQAGGMSVVPKSSVSTSPQKTSSLGTKAKSPEQNLTKPSTTLPKNQVIAPGVDTRLQLQPGETPDSYKQRVAALQGQQGKNKIQKVEKVEPIKPVTPPKPLYAQLIEDLSKRASGEDMAIQKATADLTAFRQGTAQKIADIKSDPIPLEFQQGRAQVVQQASAEKEAALSQGVQNLIQARGQDLAALQSAASLAAPVQLTPGVGLVSPVSGETLAGGVGQYQPMIQSLAQQVIGGKISPDAAAAQLSFIPGGGLILNQAIQSMTGGYNTTVGNVRASSVGELQSQINNMQAAASGAEANFSLLLNLARQGGVNATNVPILNTLQQNVSRGLTSNDAVVNFRSLLQTVRSQYAQILGGGTVTVEGLNEAKSIIPDDISLSALSALEKNLKLDAQNRIAGLTSQFDGLTGNPNSFTGSGGLFDW